MALALAALASGCSDWFGDDSMLYTGPSGATLQAGETYPSLATVPERPQPQSTAEQRTAAVAETRPLTGAAPAVAASPALPTGVPVNVAVINFTSGSANLNANDRAIIEQVVALQRVNGGTLTVVGHASHRTQPMDPQQATQLNHEISEQRARVVAEALVAAGAPAATVTVQAAGDSQPVYAESMPTGEVGNQRADIFLTR